MGQGIRDRVCCLPWFGKPLHSPVQTLGLCPASSDPISSVFPFASLSFPIPDLRVFLVIPHCFQSFKEVSSLQGKMISFQTGTGTNYVSKMLPACLSGRSEGRCPGKVVVHRIPGKMRDALKPNQAELFKGGFLYGKSFN